MQQTKREIATQELQNQLTVLTSLNLPKATVKTVELHLSSKKIRDYNADDFKMLYERVMSICKLVGITHAPDNDVMILLLDHLKEHHSNVSKEEIYNAFSMATAGKLDFEFVHYNRITPQIVSKVIKHYLLHRQKEVATYRAAEEKEKRQREESKKLSPKEQFNHSLSSCCLMYSNWQKTKDRDSLKYIEDWGGAAFNFLHKQGCINISDSQLKDFLQEAKEQLKSESLNSGDIKTLNQLINSPDDSKSKTSIHKRAKGIILLNLFLSLSSNNQDIKEFILSKT